jgi:DNA polymerase-3 subunit delta
MLSNQGRFEKKAVTSAVEAHGVVTRVFQLRDNEIVNWVISKAKEKGLAIPADAAQLLWQIIGSDLQKLVNELEKIGIYLKDRKAVSFDAVKAVAGDFREYTSFDLANAVGAKNREKALLILFRLVQEGEAPVGLLASIAWHFRRLTIVKSLEREGVPSDEAMKKLRPPVIFHQVAQFKAQVRRYTLDELRDVFEALLSADRMLKSSSMSGRLVLERMILRMCGV